MSEIDNIHEADKHLKQNIFVLTALALMKSAGNDDLDSILQIFKFWHEKGFVKEKDNMLFFMEYISETKDINQERLENILEKANIKGGEIMPTLAQKWKEEGCEIGIQKEKQNTVKKMYENGISLEMIIKVSGLSRLEIENLISSTH